MSSEITLLIPTMSRSDFLARLLHYYRDLDFRGCICIGDSSDELHVKRARSTIEALRDELNIVYQEYPGLTEAACLQRLLQSVATPYVAWVADDDFLVPSALEQCVGFLDSHPDYSAVHGVAAAFGLEHDGPHGRVVDTYRYNQPSVEAASGSQRLIDYLGDYLPTVFSVRRAESCRAMFRDVSPVVDRAFRGELLPGCHSVIQGKIKRLDCLYMVRQHHSRRILMANGFEWITSDDWLPSYKCFRDSLSQELVRQDSISENEAGEVVQTALWGYIRRRLNANWNERYSQDGSVLRTRLRKVARHTPGVRRAWHRARAFIPGRANSLSLPAMLSPISPYHRDFMPIYRAVTDGPVPV